MGSRGEFAFVVMFVLVQLVFLADRVQSDSGDTLLDLWPNTFQQHDSRCRPAIRPNGSQCHGIGFGKISGNGVVHPQRKQL